MSHLEPVEGSEPAGRAASETDGVVSSQRVEVAPGEVVTERTVVAPPSRRRRFGVGIAIVLVGLITILGLGLSASGGTSHLNLNGQDTGVQLPTISVPGAATVYVLGAVILLLGILQIVRGLAGAALRWTGIAVGLLFVLAFLVWEGSAGKQDVQVASLLQQTLLLSTPIILGAMGGVLCEKTGVINVAIEGQMLVGAFAGALFGTIAGTWVGLVGAAVLGGLMGALLAVFAIRFLVNQVILGVVLNAFAVGLTGYLYDALMANDAAATNTPGVFHPVKIPLLGDIPVIGPLLFDQTVIVYGMYLVVIVLDVMLARTRWGLRTRAVGEHPKAADTVGIAVNRLRYQNVVVGGCVAGVAGAALTIGSVGQFSKGITSGQGFIALAAVIFGRWTPRGALLASLFFGFASALQTALSLFQTMPVKIDANLLAMLPYLATIFAVAGLVGRVRAPAADGEPYVKG